ncbi:Dihydrouridine synthase (Dus), putative [Angomonas deanei]|uniref:Dihydrouridine synthase (Dus), putative n=1 Tax=Angomonas deanei TaxID=59799 RepID=A0A7G2CAF0_9TRYP|nr:Dihydrouridine synthase (Dus), putative [Angomonas deanei]
MEWADLEKEWAQHHAQDVFVHHDLTSAIRQSQQEVEQFMKQHADLVRTLTQAYVTPAEGAPVDPGCGDLFYDLYRKLQTIQAPMVRCSRPAFRKLCRLWGTTINYSHMIVASSFTQSDRARHAEFGLYKGEERLVTQLAATSGPSAAEAAVLLSPYGDAIDLNCGCPQRWAMQEGFGAALLEKPELVSDMIKCIRNAVPSITVAGGTSVPFPCVVKMRVKEDIRQSVDFVRQCEAAGASWVTVHGRTPTSPPSCPVHHADVALLKENVSIPIVLNGSVESPSSALALAFLSGGVGSVMSGNGLLENPACLAAFPNGEALREATSYHFSTSTSGTTLSTVLRSSSESSLDRLAAPNPSATPPRLLWSVPFTPVEVLSDFVRLAIATDLSYATTMQQLVHMARPYLSAVERNYVMALRSNTAACGALQGLGLYTDKGRFTSV